MKFGFHGIWQGTAVLYDRETKSQWLHITGECVRGEMKGVKLPLISGRHVLWKEWRRDHPDTEVMGEEHAFKGRYMSRYESQRGLDLFPRGFLSTIQNRDQRVPLSELCMGVVVGEVAKAYPYSALERAPRGVINDTLGDTPLVVALDTDTRSAVAYRRQLGDDVFELQRAPDGRLQERGGDSIFDLAGRCVAGPRKGKQLESVTSLQAEWYGWYAVYPATLLYKPEDLAPKP